MCARMSWGQQSHAALEHQFPTRWGLHIRYPLLQIFPLRFITTANLQLWSSNRNDFTVGVATHEELYWRVSAVRRLRTTDLESTALFEDLGSLLCLEFPIILFGWGPWLMEPWLRCLVEGGDWWMKGYAETEETWPGCSSSRSTGDNFHFHV